MALCDVDKKKIGKNYIPYNSHTRSNGRPVDIVHFKDAEPPFVICVKIVGKKMCLTNLNKFILESYKR